MHAAIFANGDFIDSPLARDAYARCAYIIAADGGARHCRALDIVPQAVIGDMDSIDPVLLNEYKSKNVELIRFPSGKNETDLELALAHVRDAQEIIVFGGFGDRWDFTLANPLLVARPAFQTLPIRFIHGDMEVFLLHAGAPRHIDGSPGDRISLLPLADVAEGITLEGFRYPLNNETLTFGEARGLSNELSTETGIISIARGSLLCFHTHDRVPTAESA